MGLLKFSLLSLGSSLVFLVEFLVLFELFLELGERSFEFGLFQDLCLLVCIDALVLYQVIERFVRVCSDNAVNSRGIDLELVSALESLGMSQIVTYDLLVYTADVP